LQNKFLVAEKFFLKKMKHSGTLDLRYELNNISLNDLIGKKISIEFTGLIECVNCQRKIKKTFSDGYCFPCFQKLAACDICILKPELCHYSKGTCREPEWGQKHCLIPHVVYLSNTSGLKVGLTREHKKFERWGDQGATSAIVIARVPERYIAGQMEVHLKSNLADKTNWRALIKGQESMADLNLEKKKLLSNLTGEVRNFFVEGGEWDQVYNFKYPVLKYPEKAVTHDLEKQPKLESQLMGIRGQYLLFEDKALNVRKYTGYEVIFTAY
jgi:Protein of unknown function (DUF2797)